MGAGGSVNASPVVTMTPVLPVSKKRGNGGRVSKVQKMVNKIQAEIRARQDSIVVGGNLSPILEETGDAKDDETEPELDLQQCQLYHPSTYLQKPPKVDFR